jgi:hypothetical protein
MKRLLLLLFLLPLTLYSQEKIEESWYSLLLEGSTVGYFHQTTWQTADGLVRSELEQTMQIRRFGTPFYMTQRDVWLEREGKLVSVLSEQDMNGQQQRIEARVVQGGLRVRLIRGGEEDVRLVSVEEEPIGVHTAGLQVAAALRDWSNSDGSNGGNQDLDYSLFSPETLKVEEVNLQILGRGQVDDSLGRTHSGVLVEERFSGLPGVVTTEVYDENAEFLYSKTPVGLALEIMRLEGGLEGDPGDSTAMAPSGPAGDQPGDDPEVSAVFDVASLTIPVRGIRRLSAPLERTEAVSIRFRGPGLATLQEALRSTEKDLSVGGNTPPTRIVSREKDGSGGELVVLLENRGFGSGSLRSVPIDSQILPMQIEDYLGGGFHLNLKDPRLAELLARCGIEASDSGTAIAAEQVNCLTRLVHSYIEHKSLAYGFAGLEEILDQKAGDCTEHALLLCALLRRTGIPSRLAYGLILTEIGFIGHAWAEIFTGKRWQWIDPSFPDGRPYGMKLRLGVMDPAEPVWAKLGLALLQVVSGVEAEILEARVP